MNMNMNMDMQVIAHRGASGYAPENTRAAFARAIAMGSDAIETDVQITADGRLVLMHDLAVDRTSNGHGPVADFTFDELRALDFGAWFGAKFAGECVLTAAEMVADFVPRIPVVFEIKDARATLPLVALLAGAQVLDRVQITSFLWGPLLDAQAANAAVTLGFLTSTFTEEMVSRIARRGFSQICPHVSTLTARRVEIAHAAGLQVRGWGIAQRYEVDRLRETGVDGATVNWPDWITRGI